MQDFYEIGKQRRNGVGQMTSVIRAQLQSLLLFWGYDHLLFVLTFSEMARLCLLLLAKSWGSWKARVTAFPMAFRSVLGAVPSWSHIEEGLLGFVTSLPAPPATLRSPPPHQALNSQISVATVLFLLLISPENEVAVATERLFPFLFPPPTPP